MDINSFDHSPSSIWIVEKLATYHLTSRVEWLSFLRFGNNEVECRKDYKTLENPFVVTFGNNKVKYDLGHMSTHLELSNGNFIEMKLIICLT